MKTINSNELNNDIYWVCEKCGQKALKQPENKGKKQDRRSAWYTCMCDICKGQTAVTEARDFGYPIFKINN